MSLIERGITVERMHDPDVRIGPYTTVNDAIRILPEAVTVFHDRGIDSCCGGGLPIGEACRRHGLDVEIVLKELEAVALG